MNAPRAYDPTLVGGKMRWDMSPDRLDTVLVPYRDNCKYLRSIRYEYTERDGVVDESSIVAIGDMHIPESCYIDSTGHFNAVEFQIGANQLMYALGAEAARLGLIRAFSGMDLEGYYHRQLSNVLITNVTCAFRRVMNPRKFTGRLELDRAYLLRDRAFWECTLTYFDDEDGLADGTIVVTMSLGERLAPKE